MKPTIYLAFVDDWELSGNGPGSVRELQIEPMRELVGEPPFVVSLGEKEGEADSFAELWNEMTSDSSSWIFSIGISFAGSALCPPSHRPDVSGCGGATFCELSWKIVPASSVANARAARA